VKVKGRHAKSYKVRLGWAGCKLVFGQSTYQRYEDREEFRIYYNRDI